MDRRTLLKGAITLATVSSTISEGEAQTYATPYPTQLGLRPPRGPPALRGAVLVAVPPRCYVYGRTQCLAEQTNIVREGIISQLSEDGLTTLASFRVRYERPDQTGIFADNRNRLFPPVSRMTWIRTEYPGPVGAFEPKWESGENHWWKRDFVVSCDQRWRNGEGVFRIVYSPEAARVLPVGLIGV